METNIKVEGLTLSMMQTNCYIVSNRDTKECVVIDPASSAEHIRDTINRNGYTLKAILLTHGHFDHIGGAKRLKSFFDVPILAAEAEKPVLLNTAVNLSDEFGGRRGDCSGRLSDKNNTDTGTYLRRYVLLCSRGIRIVLWRYAVFGVGGTDRFSYRKHVRAGAFCGDKAVCPAGGYGGVSGAWQLYLHRI